MAIDTIESVPGSLIEPIPAPKRSRGRPPKVDPATGERVNPPRGNASGSRTTPRKAPRRPATRARAPKSLYPEISATIGVVNMLVAMSPMGTRADPVTGEIKLGDELDAGEIALLAKSLDAQCQRSPRFRKQVERILGVGAGGQLVTAIALIATRRASRHGLPGVPAELDAMVGVMIAGGDLGALGTFTPSPDGIGDPVASTGEEPPQPLDDATDFETMG